jgi:hypothetical protein
MDLLVLRSVKEPVVKISCHNSKVRASLGRVGGELVAGEKSSYKLWELWALFNGEGNG